MTPLDLSFRLLSQQPIPADHGYFVYAAISSLLPEFHSQNGIAIHPIRGRQIGDRQLALTDHSRLTFRVRDGEIAPLLKLAGQPLRIGPATVRVGVPHVHALVPATALRSRMVTIKLAQSESKEDVLSADEFLAAARKQLTDLGVSPEAKLEIPPRPGRDDSPPQLRRRTLRIKEKEIVGYELLASQLSAEDSLLLQTHGLGGRRHMGCGVFVGVRG